MDAERNLEGARRRSGGGTWDPSGGLCRGTESGPFAGTMCIRDRTFTREDVVEINCHGGAYIQGRILELLFQSGARLAEPGEFTKRAFLNGRMDLSQDVYKRQP